MKILTLTNLYPPFYVGGYELCCAAISTALRERGHQVAVLTSNHGLEKEKGPAPALEEPWVQRRLRIHGYYGHPWLGIGALRELEFHNHATLRQTVAEMSPDLVHVWCMGGLSKSLCLTLQALNVPTVYHISDHWVLRSLVGDVWLDWWNRRGGSPGARILRAWWTLLGKRRAWQLLAPTNPVTQIHFQRCYFTSARLRDLTVEKGYQVGHGAVIHCQVDTGHFHGTPAPPGQPLRKLLWVGRLAEDKGILTALKAMVRLGPVENLELCVYGRGDAEYVRMLHQFAQEHQLPVSWHSATPEKMPEVYRSHDALVFTSEWEEPFALTPLEAMACGLPVIGTMTGGSRELFRHGENALTYEAGDASQLAERLRLLLASAELRARLASTGHEEVRSRFAMPVIVDQVEHYLSETLDCWRAEQLPDYRFS